MRNASSNINQHDQYNAFALNYCTHCVITVSLGPCGHTMCRPVLVVACAQSIKWKTMDCGWKCIVTNTFLQMQCRIKNRKKKTNSHWHNVCVSVWMVWIVCIAQPGTKETTQTKTKNEQKKNPKISGIVFRWITTIGLLFYDIPEYSAAQWYGWLTSGALVKQNNSQYYNVNQGISSLTQHIQLTNMAIYEEWRRNQINRPIHTKRIAFFGLLHTEQK